MDDRARRIGENEVLFREVNDQIEELNDKLGVRLDQMTIVCECGRGDCVERIAIDGPEYQRVRSDATAFVVVPGHVWPEFERVIEDHRTYQVIQKREGEPAAIAIEGERRK